MPLPEPYSKADDPVLVRGCIDGDDQAWEALRGRHGDLIATVALRVLDERRPGEVAEAPLIVERVMELLRRNQAGPLRTWNDRSSLRHYLAVITRLESLSHVQDETPIASLVAPPPTPIGVFLDDLVGPEPGEIAEALDRLGPQVMAVMRLRLRELTASDIAAALGSTEKSILQHLERMADRLGELSDEADRPAATLAWRVVLDCATPEERVSCALRTLDQESFCALRTSAEKTWRAVRERSLSIPLPKLASCLDAHGLSTFVDGTMRGAGRARAEGHLNTCGRCTDAVAMLVLDARTVGPLREAAGLHPLVAVASACVATQRFRAGEELCLRARDDGAEAAEAILRLARVGLRLRERFDDPTPEPPSRVIPTLAIPTDDEAPLVALEALAAGDPTEAAAAIDDHMAKHRLGSHLRMLSGAAGHDLEEGHARAAAVLEFTSPPPRLLRDAKCIDALPPGTPLPREILVMSLRGVLEDVVRFVVTR